MIEQLITHLSKRPIVPILENFSEKNSEKALKLMSVVDYHTDHRGLYNRLKQNPKLLTQLLKFDSYESFQYYECHFRADLKELIGEKVSKCKFCEFIGPYTYIIISHGTHISMKDCLYCSRDLAVHDKEMIATCYSKHLTDNDITINDYDIVTVQSFYKLLKEISKYLDVLIRRLDTFAGIRYLKKDPIMLQIEGLPLMYEVSKSKISLKKIDNEKLEDSFRKAMAQIYGSYSLTMFRTKKQSHENSTIIILSDDDDENTTVGNDLPNQEPELNQSELKAIKVEKIDNANKAPRSEQEKQDTTEAETSSVVKSETDESQADEFARYVSCRLRRLSDTRKRRRLELEIQKTIIKLEEEDI